MASCPIVAFREAPIRYPCEKKNHAAQGSMPRGAHVARHVEVWSSNMVADADCAFEATASFGGARPGWVFKSGSKGLGYYSDGPLPKEPAAAPVEAVPQLASAVGEVRLNEFLTSLSLQHLAPVLAAEELTYELLESMQGEEFVSEISELGISSEDAERLEAALLVASSTAPAKTTPAPAKSTPAPLAVSSQGPPALPTGMPNSSSDRHAAVTAALEKATGVSQSSALAAALALVGKPTAVSPSSIVAYEPPVLPSAQAMIDTRAPSSAPKGPATKNAALKRYQDRFIDPSERAILEQDRQWRAEATAEARYRDRHANPLSWHRNNI